MLYRKPADMKFTDLCIWIDDNVEKLQNPGEYPIIEDTIYNYLWLLVKALAIKKRMFTSFDDYDGYAFYAASRLFFALRKNLQNQGKVIKGKEIKPIKSCLNYTKALLYPMKIEYQRETYANDAYRETINGKFDKFDFTEKLKDTLEHSQGADVNFKNMAVDLFTDIESVVNKTISTSPFSPNTLDYKHLKISLLLNIYSNMKANKSLDFDPVTIILWKLPKSSSAYIRVLLKSFAANLKSELMSCYSETRIDDTILTYMLTNPNGEFNNHDEEND